MSVTGDSGLQSKGLFESVDDVAGLIFLTKADNRIEKEESADDTEVNPILHTGSQDGRDLLEFFVNLHSKCMQEEVHGEKLIPP